MAEIYTFAIIDPAGEVSRLKALTPQWARCYALHGTMAVLPLADGGVVKTGFLGAGKLVVKGNVTTVTECFATVRVNRDGQVRHLAFADTAAEAMRNHSAFT